MAHDRLDGYKQYHSKTRERSAGSLDHLLAVYDVRVKFIPEGSITRVIGGEGRFQLESLGFGSIPDASIHYPGGECSLKLISGRNRERW